jgi:hypothetical protein
MARQGGQVKLEQSGMRLALNMAKIAKEGFSYATMEETKYLIKKPHTQVREEHMRGVEFFGHQRVKAVIDRHPAMLPLYHTSGCISCQNGTTKNLQTHMRCKGSGALTPDQHRQPTPELIPPLPGTPPALTGKHS